MLYGMEELRELVRRRVVIKTRDRHRIDSEVKASKLNARMMQ